MKKLLYILANFIKNPTIRLITNLILLASGILDLNETTLEEVMGIEVKIHHGIIVFCIAKILESVIEIVERYSKLQEVRTQS